MRTRLRTDDVERHSGAGAAAGRGDWQPLGQPRTPTTRLYPYNPRFQWLWCRQQEAAEPQLRIEGEDRRQAEHDGEGSQGMGGAEVPRRKRC